MTKYHPVLFNGPMARAIREGNKTQTRRPMKPQPAPYGGSRIWWQFSKRSSISCAVGDTAYTDWVRYLPWAVGDRLWVRETWAPADIDGPAVVYRADAEEDGSVPYLMRGSGGFGGGVGSFTPRKWRPSIHMPRWASRITLEITAVRVQRLQDISEADAQAEDAYECPWCHNSGWINTGPDGGEQCHNIRICGASPVDLFHRVWDDIYGRKPGLSWDDNPWVVATTFERVEA